MWWPCQSQIIQRDINMTRANKPRNVYYTAYPTSYIGRKILLQSCLLLFICVAAIVRVEQSLSLTDLCEIKIAGIELRRVSRRRLLFSCPIKNTLLTIFLNWGFFRFSSMIAPSIVLSKSMCLYTRVFFRQWI